MSRSPKSGPSQRMLRVGEQVRHALAGMLQRGEVSDDLIGTAVISVSEVRMSPDLKIATAFVAPMGAKDDAAVVAALNRNARFIRGRVSPALRQMKYMPEVRFRLDTSYDNFQKINELLHSPEVARDLDRGDDGLAQRLKRVVEFMPAVEIGDAGSRSADCAGLRQVGAGREILDSAGQDDGPDGLVRLCLAAGRHDLVHRLRADRVASRGAVEGDDKSRAVAFRPDGFVAHAPFSLAWNEIRRAFTAVAASYCTQCPAPGMVWNAMSRRAARQRCWRSSIEG